MKQVEKIYKLIFRKRNKQHLAYNFCLFILLLNQSDFFINTTRKKIVELIRQYQDQFIEQRDLACSDFLNSKVILSGISDMALVFNNLPIAAITGSVARVLEFSHNYFCRGLGFKQAVLNSLSTLDMLRTATVISKMHPHPSNGLIQMSFSAICLATHLTTNLFMSSSASVEAVEAIDINESKYLKVYELFYEVYNLFVEQNKPVDLKSVSDFWQKYLDIIENAETLRQGLLDIYSKTTNNPNECNNQIYRLGALFNQAIDDLHRTSNELREKIDKVKYYLLDLAHAKKIVNPTLIDWALLMTELQSLTFGFSRRYKQNSFHLGVTGKKTFNHEYLLNELHAYKQLMDYIRYRIDKHPRLIPKCLFMSTQVSKQKDNCDPHFTFVSHKEIKIQLDRFLKSYSFGLKELKNEKKFLELFRVLDIHRGYNKILKLFEEKKGEFPLLPEEIEAKNVFKEIIPGLDVLRPDFSEVLKKACKLVNNSYSNLNQVTEIYLTNDKKNSDNQLVNFMKDIRANLTELSKLYDNSYFSILSKLLSSATLNRLLYVLSEKEYLESVRFNGYELKALDTGIESLEFHLNELVRFAFRKHLHS